jgi:hypothetical protein
MEIVSPDLRQHLAQYLSHAALIAAKQGQPLSEIGCRRRLVIDNLDPRGDLAIHRSDGRAQHIAASNLIAMHSGH